MVRTRSTKGPNRSEFIRAQFKNNWNAGFKDVNAAWKAAGHEGEIGSALFYQVKGRLGYSGTRRGQRRGRPSKSKGADAVPAPVSADSHYLSIEQSLDELIAQAELLGDRRLSDDLKNARRRASAKLV